MSVGEWVILGIAIVAIVFGGIVIIKESIKNKKSDSILSDDDESFFCYDGVVIYKKVIGSRIEGLILPKTLIEYGIFFLLKSGEQKLYLLPENIFNQLKEGTKGNLYIKNDVFFDFEEIE